ncbi:hypothetical protein PG988_002114 [Apiospora saccharicola]
MSHSSCSVCPTWASGAIGRLQQESDHGLEAIVDTAWAITIWCYAGDGDVSFSSVSGGAQRRRLVSVNGALAISSLTQAFKEKAAEEVSETPNAPSGPNLQQNPLSSTVTVLANGDAETDLPTVLESYPTGLVCSSGAGQVTCAVYFDEEAIDGKAAERLAATFAHSVDLVLSNTDSTLDSVDIASQNDIEELWSWNNAQAPETVNNCAHLLFQNQVERQPQATAVDALDGSFTYRELDRCSDRIAHYLVSMGTGPESIVPLCFEKSRWAIAALMGVIKAGGVMVFIDPANPRSRREEILKQLPNADFVLTDAHHEASWQEMAVRPIVVDDELVQGLREYGITPRTGVSPSNLLYIIFTSGSTGIPKACQITHSAFLSGALQHAAKSCLGPESRVLQLASYSFDVSVLEILTSLISGACVCTPGNAAMVQGLAATINQYQITWSFLTPSLVKLIKPDEVPTLKTLILGGELLHKADIQIWAPRLQLVNGYGPSECSIAAAGDPHLDPDSDPANIGRAVGGLGWIVQADDHDRLVPIGAVGELLISGPILARGYLNNPEKTAEVFIERPAWTKGASGPAASFHRFYKTGDLARFNSDGTIHFIGRKDTQVKLRGLRIELGEIEHHIGQHPLVNHVAVHLPKQGPCSDKLVAVLSLNDFSVASETGSSKAAIRLVNNNNSSEAKSQLDAVKTSLTGKMPEYMIPSVFVAIDAWPLLTSAKLDRKRMQKWLLDMAVETYRGIIGIETAQSSSSKEEAEGITETKALLVDIFSRVLNMPAELIPDDKSFLGLGGDSITAMQVMSQCRKHGISVTVRHILRSQNVQELAASAKRSATSNQASTEEKLDHPFQLAPVQRMHSMLRCRFHRDASGDWTQMVWSRAEGAYRFKCHTLRSIEDAGVIATIAQRTLGLAGPVFSVDLLQLGEEQYLFMVAHHAVIDWVSWRILLRDLEEYLGTGAISAPRPLPFQNWINLQAQHEAENGEPGKTLPFKVPPPDFAYWEADANDNAVADTTERTFRLDKETTALLLGDQPHKALRTETLDFLLGALFLSFGRIFPDRELPAIFREGHGREPWDASLDVAGTVGWFTTMYPLAIEAVPSDDNLLSVLAKVKDVRHRVPDNGRPYFASRFHNERAAALFGDHDLVEVSFDYLGQFQTLERADATLRQEPRPAFMPQSDDMGKNLDRLSLIEITAEIVEGQMQFTFVYNANMKFQERLGAWVEASKRALEELVAETLKAGPSCTLSDFPLLPGLSYEGLEMLVKNRLPQAGITDVAAVEDIYPCSPMQQGLLVSQSLSSTSVYEYCHVMERFADAWARVVQRHSSLRTIFLESTQGGGLYDQVVLKSYIPSNTTISRCSSEEDVQGIFQQSTAVALNARKPPHRLTICAVGEDKLICQLQINHAIVDGGSIANMLGDLSQAYQGSLPDHAGFRFSDYIEHIQHNTEASASLEFWTTHLRDAPSCLTFEMAISLSASSLQAFCEGSNMTPVSLFQVAWALVLKVYTESPDVCFGYLCSGRDAPLPGIEGGVGAFLTMLVCRLRLADDTTLRTALETVADDFVRSLPHQHAGLADIQHALGMNGSPLFNTLLSFHRNEQESHEQTANDAGTGSGTGIAIRSLSVQDPTEYPLSLEIGFSKEKVSASMQHSVAHLTSGQARSIANTFDQALRTIVHQPDTTVGGADLVSQYDMDRFSEFNTASLDFSNRLMFAPIMEHAQTQPEAEAISSWDGSWTYRELDEVSTRLAHHLRSLGVGPEVVVPHCFHKSAWAAITMLAISKAGGAFVGLDPAHPRDRLVDLMAEVKATVLCVSADTAPIFQDMEHHVQLVMVEPLLIDSLPPSKEDEELPPCPELRPDNLACIILTSGTTGRPKTIAIEHRSMSTMSDLIGPHLDMDQNSRVFNFASFTYDISTHDIFVTLQRGGCVCMPSEEERVNDPAAAIRRLRANWVSMTNTVLSLLRPSQVPTLKFIITGGEPVAKETVETWVDAGGVKMVLGCGPAETTITMSVSAPIGAHSHHRNIGRVYGGRAWIVDPQDHDKLLPLGAAGEVLLEGPQLARCYLGDAQKTAEAFIYNPKWARAMTTPAGGESRRFYKSGDICRWNSDGSMSIIGRKDTQVKINGRRVELDEISYQIQACLPANSSSSQVKVVVDAMDLQKTGNNTRGLTLVAFLQYASDSSTQTDSPLLVVPASDEMLLGHTELQEKLASRLPQYMLPSLYVPIAFVPRTPNGKLDRRRLHAAIEGLSEAQTAQYSLVDGVKKAPETEMERLLQQLWSGVLSKPPEAVGAHDDFFRAGGDSVSAIRLVAAARDRGVSLSVPGIFRAPRLSDMARTMVMARAAGEEQSEDDDAAVVEDKPFDLLPSTTASSPSAVDQIRAEAAEQCGVQASNIVDLYPCTPLQEALMGLSARLGGGTYMAQKVFRLTDASDNFNRSAFQSAWNEVAASEPILRTRIVHTHDAGTLQAVLDREIEWLDITTEEKLQDYLERDIRTPTTYGSPLIRLAFVQEKAAGGARFFVWSAHHAVYDAWSAAITVAQIRGVLAGHRDVPKSIPYKHLIRHLGQTSSEAQVAFWESQFPVAKGTPTGYPSVPVNYTPTNHGVVKGTLSRTKITGRGAVTAPTILRAAWAVTVARYSDSDDVVFAASLSGRTVPVAGITAMNGPTLATVPVRASFQQASGSTSVQQYLERVQEHATDMMPYEQTGLQRIRRIGDATRAAVDSIGSLLVVQAPSSSSSADGNAEEEGFQGMEVVPLDLGQFDSYPLVMICETDDATGCITVEARHDLSLISRTQAQRIVKQYASVLDQLCGSSSHSPMTQLVKPVLPGSEDTSEIMGWNGAAVPEPSERCIHQVVDARARETPQAPAVCAWDGDFSYNELVQTSDRLAAHLQSSTLGVGVGAEAKVAICIEKSKWHPVAMLAVLKAGGAYTNLNPAYPPSMLRHVLDELEATTIICSPSLASLFASFTDTAYNLVVLEQDFIERLPTAPITPVVGPSNSAMVVFTSGSTGKPKGVVIEHAQFSSMEAAQSPQLGIGPSSRVLQFAAHWFDISNFDCFNTLMRGACLCIPSESERLDDLAAAVNKYGVNWATMVPTAAVALHRPDEVPGLKTLSLGGEPIRPDLHARWSGRVRLISSYGPAECSVLTTLGDLTPGTSSQNIGSGLGCRTWVVDKDDHDRLVPVGCVGELCVEGPIVARGYLNRPDLTTGAFVRDPGFAKQLGLPTGMRMYKTGDLVRYSADDGSLLYVGRSDSQVKIHGRRIECGEVEHHIVRSGLPADGVAVERIHEGGSSDRPVLAAFICLPQAQPASVNTGTVTEVTMLQSLDVEGRRQVSRLCEKLESNIPAYMVPSLFIALQRMPVTQTGKKDRKALRVLGAQLTPDQLQQYRIIAGGDSCVEQADDDSDSVCSTELERKLQALWAQVLGIAPESIRPNDHFLQKGGDSVRAISLATATRRALGRAALTVTDIFRHPRLKNMAELLEVRQDDDDAAALTKNSVGTNEDEQEELLPFALVGGDNELVLEHAARECNVAPESIQDAYPCTPLQEGLMAISAYTPGAYVATRVFSVPETIDLNHFKAAWARAVDMFPILRTRIIPGPDAGPTSSLQVVLKEEPIEWDEVRSSVKTYLAQPDHFRARAVEYGQPLSAYALAPRSRRFVWSIHHALYDGVSAAKLLQIVQCLCVGELPAPAAVFPGFNRFIRHLAEVDTAQSDQFWRRELSGGAPASFPRLPFSSYQAQPDSEFVSSFRMVHDQRASGILKSTLLRSAWALLTARYMESDDVVFGETLSGRNSAVDGGAEGFMGPTMTTVPVRIKLDGQRQTVAQFLHRVQESSAAMIPFQHVGLQALRKLGPEVRASLQFNNLFEIFNAQQDEEEQDGTDKQGNDVLVEIQDSQLLKGFFDSYALVMECVLQTDDTVKLEVRYDNSILSAWQVERMCGHFEQIAAQLGCTSTESQTRVLEDIDMANAADMAIMQAWNESRDQNQDQDQDPLGPVERTVHDIFADQVRAQPQAVAISGWDGELTYEQLDAVSTVVARILVSSWDVQPEDIVPVCFEKSKWAIVAALGVLKAGGAVTQLGISHPMARKKEILQTTQARFVIASPTQARGLQDELLRDDVGVLVIGEQRIRELAQNMKSNKRQASSVSLLPQVRPHNTAYVLFTSGSTGRPKGIVVEHRQLCSSSRAHGAAFGIGPGTRVLQFAAYTFDISCADIFTTLQRGGTVCVPSEDERIDDLAGAVAKYQADWMFVTPTVAQNFLAPASSVPPSLKRLVLGGEAPTRENIETWADKVDLTFIWGPAETTIYASANPPATLESDPARLGRPLGCRLWLCDPRDHDRITPLGCVGEIVVEGPVVTRGYLHDEEKTAAAYIQDPLWAVAAAASSNSSNSKTEPPRRMYKTGDLAQFDEDGVLRYVGRKDNQVKLHGQRLELGEVEHQILAHPTVRHAVARIPRAGPLKDKLVAAVSFHDEALPPSTSTESNTEESLVPLSHSAMAEMDMAGIRQDLESSLPTYMVPSVWVGVQAIPLNGNGKIDRNKVGDWFETMDQPAYEALVMGGGASSSSSTEEGGPERQAATPQEAIVQAVVCRVLNISGARLRRSFLSLGGDSITAMQLRTKARAQGLELTVQDILKSKNLEVLAAAAKFTGAGAAKLQPSTVQKQKQQQSGESESDAFGLSPIQSLFFDTMAGASSSALHSFDQSFLFQVNQKVDADALRSALEALVTRHAMLRARFSKTAEGKWSQRISSGGVHESFGLHIDEVQDLQEAKQILTNKDYHGNSFEIQNGPVFAAHLFEVGAGPQKEQQQQLLFLGAHHLVVDLVSWRIILNDLQELLVAGRLSTTESPLSFQTWLQTQEQYASSLKLDEVLPYDNTAVVPAADLAYWGMTGQPNIFGTMAEKDFVLDEATTSRLFGSCNQALNTEPVDVILAALMTAFRSVFADRPMPAIFSEGHGRETWDDSIDPNGTVGWFTTISPVYLASPSSDLTENVRSTKDIRRNMPGNGMPYFTSRFLTPEGRERFGGNPPGAGGPMAELLFNYAGKYQQLETQDALFTPVHDGDDDSQVCRIDGAVERFALFDITAAVSHGQARVSINYSRHMRHQDRIDQWVATVRDTLIRGAEALDAMGPQAPTVGDFPLLRNLRLDPGQLGAVEKRLAASSVPMGNVADMYPCTSMQQHMLAAQQQQQQQHSNSRGGGREGLYEVDISHYIKGKVDVERLRTAWQKVVDHHSILRAGFLPVPGDRHNYLQVVLARYDAEVPVIACADEEELVACVKGYKSVRYGGSAENDGHPPMRPHQQFTLFTTTTASKKGGSRSSSSSPMVACKLEISHALNDGISTGILFRDLDLAYRGQPLKSVSHAAEFGDYVAWSDKLKTGEAVQYWRDMMLSQTQLKKDMFTTPMRKTLEICLDRALVAMLPSFTRQQGVTMATFFQTVWGLVLQSTARSSSSSSSSSAGGRRGGSSATTTTAKTPLSPFFGYMTANRDAFPGAEDMVGPLTNMLLCRSDFDTSLRVGDLLKRRQAEYLDSLPQQFGLGPAVKEIMDEEDGETTWEGRLPNGLCNSVMSLQYVNMDTTSGHIPAEDKKKNNNPAAATKTTANSGKKRAQPAHGRTVIGHQTQNPRAVSPPLKEEEESNNNNNHLTLQPLAYQDPNDYDISVGVQIMTARRSHNHQQHQQQVLGIKDADANNNNNSVKIKAQFVYWTDTISDGRAALIKRAFERCAAELVGCHYYGGSSNNNNNGSCSAAAASSAGLRVWMLMRRVGMASA